MIYELSILTNDGWVVTLVTDKQVTLGDAIVDHVIVQPREDYAKRISERPLSDGIARLEYRRGADGKPIEEQHIVVAHCGAMSTDSYICTRDIGHSGDHIASAHTGTECKRWKS